MQKGGHNDKYARILGPRRQENFRTRAHGGRTGIPHAPSAARQRRISLTATLLRLTAQPTMEVSTHQGNVVKGGFSSAIKDKNRCLKWEIQMEMFQSASRQENPSPGSGPYLTIHAQQALNKQQRKKYNTQCLSLSHTLSASFTLVVLALFTLFSKRFASVWIRHKDARHTFSYSNGDKMLTYKRITAMAIALSLNYYQKCLFLAEKWQNLNPYRLVVSVCPSVHHVK